MPRKKNIQSFLRKRSVLVINLGILLLVIWGFAGEYVRNADMSAEIAELESEAARLEARNLELAVLAKRLTSPDMLEHEARLKLNLQREGEEVVVIRGEAYDTRMVAGAHALSSSHGDPVDTNPYLMNIRKWVAVFIN